MLVLTRKTGESIIIGNGIKLTVVSVGPGRVKIGIEAPPSVRIDREEVHARVQLEKAEERASDVLEAVSAAVNTNSDQATIVNGPDTGLLHAEPSPEPSRDAVAPANKLSNYRRKPR